MATGRTDSTTASNTVDMRPVSEREITSLRVEVAQPPKPPKAPRVSAAVNE